MDRISTPENIKDLDQYLKELDIGEVWTLEMLALVWIGVENDGESIHISDQKDRTGQLLRHVQWEKLLNDRRFQKILADVKCRQEQGKMARSVINYVLNRSTPDTVKPQKMEVAVTDAPTKETRNRLHYVLVLAIGTVIAGTIGYELGKSHATKIYPASSSVIAK